MTQPPAPHHPDVIALAVAGRRWVPDALEVEEVEIAPRKADINVKRVALVWVKKKGAARLAAAPFPTSP